MPTLLACHFGNSSANMGNFGLPWCEPDGEEKTEVQNVKLFLWHHLRCFVPLSVWSSAARVLINFYLGSATLTSTTLWNELCLSLWELEQWLLSRGATISRVRLSLRERGTAGEKQPCFIFSLIVVKSEAFLNYTMGFGWVSSASGGEKHSQHRRDWITDKFNWQKNQHRPKWNLSWRFHTWCVSA